MPYPLSKLAYGLRCRLNEIATPVERIKLQLAAADVSICPPKQSVLNAYNSPEFCLVNGAVTMHLKYFKIVKDLVYGKNRLITSYSDVLLTQLSFQDLNSEVFDHVFYDSGTIVLMHCNLSNLFYTMLRKALPDVKRITVYESTTDPYEFSFAHMFNCFPVLKELTVNCCTNKHWLTEILQSRNRSLRKLSVTFDTEALKFAKFDFDDLLTLLKTQKPGFRLFIGIKYEKGEVAAYISELKQFVDKNLEEDRKEGCTTISISNSLLYGIYMETWHVPLNNEM